LPPVNTNPVTSAPGTPCRWGGLQREVRAAAQVLENHNELSRILNGRAGISAVMALKLSDALRVWR